MLHFAALLIALASSNATARVVESNAAQPVPPAVTEMAKRHGVQIEQAAGGSSAHPVYLVSQDGARLGQIKFEALAAAERFLPDMENGVLILLGRKAEGAGASKPKVKVRDEAKNISDFSIEEGSSLMTVGARKLEFNASGRVAAIHIGTGTSTRTRDKVIKVKVQDEDGTKPFLVYIDAAGEPSIEYQIR